MQEDVPASYVTYENFEAKMLELLESEEYAPDGEDTLLAAFRVTYLTELFNVSAAFTGCHDVGDRHRTQGLHRRGQASRAANRGFRHTVS